jgi:D-alanyl-D-alanine carboxypeptidase (penicillin-binding protein 5/6)
MRLVSVVLGSTSMKGREDASAALLNYGFTFYDTKLVAKGGDKLATTHVWKAALPQLDLGLKDDLYVTLPRGQASDIKTATDVQPRLIAPLAQSASVGQFRVMLGNDTLATAPLHPLEADAAGSWWRRLIDTIRLWFN